MEEKKKMLLADLALLLAAICWGGGFGAGSIAANCFTPFWIMTARFLGAAVWMGIGFFRAVRNSNREDCKAGILLGLILFVGQPLQIIALRYTTASKQAFLVASYVVIVPFISWLILRKRPEKKAFLAGALALSGIGLISLGGAGGIQLGDVLSLCFSVIYSFLIVMTGIFARKTNPLAMSFFQYFTIGILSLAAALLFEKRPMVFPTNGVMALLYLMIVNTVVAYTLQNVAQRYTSDTHTAVLVSTESVFGYFCGVFLYGDPFTPRVLAGGMIVFCAVLLSVLNWKEIFKKRKEEPL